jgi:hypothetical protein
MSHTTNSCLCEREDWVYDSEVGQWCCGCGYVKEASGRGFKEGRLELADDGTVKQVEL